VSFGWPLETSQILISKIMLLAPNFTERLKCIFEEVQKSRDFFVSLKKIGTVKL